MIAPDVYGKHTARPQADATGGSSLPMNADAKRQASHLLGGLQNEVQHPGWCQGVGMGKATVNRVRRRNRIHRLLNEGSNLRQVARMVGRTPSTISREVARVEGHLYGTAYAQRAALRRRRREPRKLAAGMALLKLVRGWLRVGYSP